MRKGEDYSRSASRGHRRRRGDNRTRGCPARVPGTSGETGSRCAGGAKPQPSRHCHLPCGEARRMRSISMTHFFVSHCRGALRCVASASCLVHAGYALAQTSAPPLFVTASRSEQPLTDLLGDTMPLEAIRWIRSTTWRPCAAPRPAFMAPTRSAGSSLVPDL